MDIIWILYGYYMDIIWILYGYYMDIIWILYGHCMSVTCCLHYMRLHMCSTSHQQVCREDGSACTAHNTPPTYISCTYYPV
ncbi:hypothetical protein PMAC_002751 [Pneumocystis sp. 'macacae']|nr:hypothetical protein PMAC_002751 [Pneumocystis sp. 'macacae']